MAILVLVLLEVLWHNEFVEKYSKIGVCTHLTHREDDLQIA